MSISTYLLSLSNFLWFYRSSWRWLGVYFHRCWIIMYMSLLSSCKCCPSWAWVRSWAWVTSWTCVILSSWRSLCPIIWCRGSAHTCLCAGVCSWFIWMWRSTVLCVCTWLRTARVVVCKFWGTYWVCPGFIVFCLCCAPIILVQRKIKKKKKTLVHQHQP